jgi:hypothetical protein
LIDRVDNLQQRVSHPGLYGKIQLFDESKKSMTLEEVFPLDDPQYGTPQNGFVTIYVRWFREDGPAYGPRGADVGRILNPRTQNENAVELEKSDDCGRPIKNIRDDSTGTTSYESSYVSLRSSIDYGLRHSPEYLFNKIGEGATPTNNVSLL